MQDIARYSPGVARYEYTMRYEVESRLAGRGIPRLPDEQITEGKKSFSVYGEAML